MDESFGTRLRRQRERRQISLATIAEQTKIHQPLLEDLERDEVSHWPSGIFRRAFIRSYAEAIGLKADDVCSEFLTLYPDPIDAVIVETPQPSWWERLLGRERPRAEERSGKPFALRAEEDDVARSADSSDVARRVDSSAATLQPSVEDVDGLLEHAGIIAWAWAPDVDALVPALAAGYPDRLVAQLPRVSPDDDNATAAAFRLRKMCAVPGLEGSNGALAVPIMRGPECTGVLAVELPDGVETNASMRAAVAMLARQFGRLVDFTRLPLADRYKRPVLRRA